MNHPESDAGAAPRPTTARWQPLRLGLVELYHYDAEEFWFEDGHLLLRGNNGTGKSKVLSLTLPFLLDASLSSARLEPDADPGKRMDWNLLMGGRFERRTGYAWIEFGRVEDDGTPRFTTLGCGLRATAGRSGVDSWFFLTEQRVGFELALVTDQQTVLTRDRLAEALGSHCVHTTARDYRRAVDERLFGLGPERYRALIDTLIQLRQPQLSKQPNENNLSAALSQAFPPLDRAVLEDVAEAMTQLDEYRDELDDYRAMQAAVAQFNATYGRYARILARRRARDLRQAQTAFDNASGEARAAREALAAAQAALEASQQQVDDTERRAAETASQIEVLKDSPEMRSARELHRAQSAAEDAERAAAEARRDHEAARRRHEQDVASLERREQACRESRDGLARAIAATEQHADPAGLGAAHRQSWGETTAPDALGGLDPAARQEIAATQNGLATRREQQIAQIRRNLAAVDTAGQQHLQAQHERDARLADSEAAEQAVGDARAAQQAAAETHVADWQRFAERVAATLDADTARAWPDADEALADWVNSLDGESPLETHTQAVAERERQRLAERVGDLNQQRAAVAAERAPLLEEQARLREGGEQAPPAPMTRDADRGQRPGAPLWQLVDFRPGVDDATRAGIEAALQAAGVLDAWVSPAGELLAPDTHDLWLVDRPAQRHNLGAFLDVVVDAGDPAAAAINTDRVASILAAVAVAEDDVAPAEFWLAVDGRYRFGPARGAWAKPAAQYIGAAAREAARRQRLQAIETELAELAARDERIAAALGELGRERQQLKDLLAARPGADALRSSHAELAASERSAASARQRLAEAEDRLQRARSVLDRAREALQMDADDARLPAEPEALDAVAAHLADYKLAIRDAKAALREHAQALAERAEQSTREQASRADRDRAAARARAQQQQAEQAAARHRELQDTVGASAEEVLTRLNALEREQRTLGETLKTARAELTQANKQLGGAEQAVTDTRAQLEARQSERAEAVAAFQAFAETGLLRAAVPDLQLPETTAAWTIDPALAAARGAEAALAEVADSDADWQRVQNRIGSEFTELQRALSARGYHSAGEPTDHGFVVRVTFNQRSEAPDRLQAMLDNEIAERRNLLTAKESEIIENHLQAEVAAQLQGLMRDADARVRAINAELDQRPTSTGVKFKLVWQPVADDDGAFTNLTDVRDRLLNKVSDAWSAEDRAAVGAFLQQRIAAERDRDDGAARIDQLARALDYRAWHRFRVRRWQDGQWKPLSGPASSGERALGLTVPLFAAAASHYESAADFAPRLVLLDEAFAGIDDGARAHCMDLIREFDLDFVMTSEREWGCYAELPGVSICHLVRRADVDAVFVSRWRWNGRARERADAPPVAGRLAG
ncbi:TIGR02680 family protein [Salinisphaera sp. RV14]|uniref:TIGR02680 family protein n=1 Tax=Salinisphaera sp. RV14 TaxID=3454140 RepID=UPI003F84EE9E